MIKFSGKTSNAGTVYALITPAIPGETSEFVTFGYLPTLAESMLLSKGWCRPGSQRAELTGGKLLTGDEIHAACEALLDPTIDPWGYRLALAETRIAREYAYIADMDDVFSYYVGEITPEAVKKEKEPVISESGGLSYLTIEDPLELRVCESVALTNDRLSIHAMLDELVEFEPDLTPDIVRQIHRQIDESDIFI